MSRLAANGILPPPPWRLRDEFVREQRRRIAAWFAGSAVALAACHAYGTSHAFAILRDLSIHGGETTTVAAQWDGVQGGFMGRMRILWGTQTAGRVSFHPEDGRPWVRRLELTTMFEFDTSRAIHVEFDAADRSRWTTDWSVEQAGNRGAQAGLMILLTGAFLVGCLLRFVRAVRLLRAARRVAPDGEAVVGVIEDSRLRSGRHESSTIHRVRVDLGDGRSFRVSASYPVGAGRPLVLPGRRVLLLVARGEHPGGLVLRQDLWPLRLSDEQVQHACDVFRQVAPGLGWRTTQTVKGLRLSCDPRAADDAAQ